MKLPFRPARRRLLQAGLAAAALPLAFPLRAEGSAGTRPYRVVVAAPGGDTLARALAAQLSQQLGTPVLVEQRPGVVGMESVARAAPDGRTLLLAHTGTLALHAATRPAAGRGSDFTPLGGVASVPLVLLVAASSPIHNVADLLMHARFGSVRLAYGSGGVGSAGHIAGELLQDSAGVKLQHVPYKGLAPALTELLSNQVDLLFGTLALAQPHLDSGRLRAVAVTGARRSAALPGCPTLAEAGVKGYECAPAYALLAPRGTPADAQAPVAAALARALESPALRETLRQDAAEVPAGADFGGLLQAETDKWSRLLAKAGVRLE